LEPAAPFGRSYRMSAEHDLDRVWDIIGSAGVAMLTTRFAGGLRARPLEPRPERAAGLIWFLTDARSGKGVEIATSPDVGLVIINPSDKAYLPITGRAGIVWDIATVLRFWKSSDSLWWSGPDDPNLRVLRLEPNTAELWDGPASAAVEMFEFVKARLTGGEPDLGENRKVTVAM
jgi:general stress protein 26